MNVQQMIVALAVSAATGSVFAAEFDAFPKEKPFVSTKTRVEIRADLAQARSQGLRARGVEPDLQVTAPERGGRSRMEVRAEAIESVRNHQHDLDHDIGG